MRRRTPPGCGAQAGSVGCFSAAGTILGAGAKDLLLFQRMPSSVDVLNDHPTDPAWVKALQPGWQRKGVVNFSIEVSGGKFEVSDTAGVQGRPLAGWCGLPAATILASRCPSGHSVTLCDATQAQPLVRGGRRADMLV